MFAPCPGAPFYGRPVRLNPSGSVFSGASAQAVFMLGAGGHYVWVDPELDAVVVLRRLDPAHAPLAIRHIATALADDRH